MKVAVVILCIVCVALSGACYYLYSTLAIHTECLGILITKNNQNADLWASQVKINEHFLDWEMWASDVINNKMDAYHYDEMRMRAAEALLGSSRRSVVEIR
jgi:hypothetical protein